MTTLADSSTSRVIRAGRHERGLVEVQRVQREPGDEIVWRLERKVDTAEQVRTFQVPPESLSTWQLVRRGRWHMQRRSPDETSASVGKVTHSEARCSVERADG